MGLSWTLGKIAGIQIKVHVTFFLALIWGAVMWGGGTISSLAYGALLTLVLFGVVLLHELGHSLAARRYGIAVHDIMLLPIGGVARLSHMPEKPTEELVVALAGPAVNLAFVLVLAPVLSISMGRGLLSGGLLPPGLETTASPIGLVGFLLLVNVSLLLFNLIPAFPLDGGRVLRALIALKLPYVRATGLAAMIGRGMAIALGFYGLVSLDFILVLVAAFIFFAAGAESYEVKTREALKGFRVTEVLESHPQILTPDLPPHLAFERLARSHRRALAVVDQEGGFLGMVSPDGIQRRWRDGQRGPLSAFLEKPGVVLDCGNALDFARQQMLEKQAWVAPVFCGRDFAGLLDLESIARVISSRGAMRHPENGGLGGVADA
jgi:Zn-dependent protease